MHCLLCCSLDENIIISNNLFRIIAVDNSDYPGYLNLVTNNHYKELTDLPMSEAQKIFLALYTIEQAVRQVYQCNKINLFSFGNKVMHCHWHIVPRYCNDKHFPNSIHGDITNPLYKPNLNIQLLQHKLSVVLKLKIKEII